MNFSLTYDGPDTDAKRFPLQFETLPDGSRIHRRMLAWLDREAAHIAATRKPLSEEQREIGRQMAERRKRYGFTLAQLRSWRVDRSSGYLRIAKDKPKGATPRQLRAGLLLALPHVPADLREYLNELAA